MGFFDRLFGASADQPGAYDPQGPIVVVVHGAGDELARELRHKRELVVVFGHDEPRLVERVAVATPAVLVICVESAGTNGFVVLKSIKRDGRLRTIPTVLFSKEAEAGLIFEQHQKLRTRADAYVTSTSPRDIANAVAALLPGSQAGGD